MHFTIYGTFFTESSPLLVVPVFQILLVFGEYFMYGKPVLLISRKWRVIRDNSGSLPFVSDKEALGYSYYQKIKHINCDDSI